MNQRGFTLTELMVACAVMGIVMAGIFTLQQQGQLAYLWGASRVEVQQNARLALDVMTRELRSALTVTNCAATTIAFTDGSAVAVTYARAGGASPYTLQRTYSGTTTDVIGGLDVLSFTCYTSDGYTTTTTAASVRSVLIQVRTRPEQNIQAGQPGGQQAVVESRVRLRNL